ncbi:hypothetical protein LCGC14_0195400 [marine sediment metagenome]|uniref:Uncharacterized protein n=1 Tax=marine sediment metagenome TaxID=412755 RepID=A0A0F9V1W0_9ZZZZ
MITEVGILEYIPEYVNLSDKEKQKLIAKINDMLKQRGLTAEDIDVLFSDETSFVFRVRYKNGAITVRISKDRVIFDSSAFTMSQTELDKVKEEIQEALIKAGTDIKLPQTVAIARLKQAGFRTTKTRRHHGKQSVRMRVPDKYKKLVMKKKLDQQRLKS